jgi:hypothetical protein
LTQLERDYWRFEEPGRVSELEIHLMFGHHPELVIYPSTICVQHDAGGAPPDLTEQERDRIAEKVAEHFRAMGTSVEIDRSGA